VEGLIGELNELRAQLLEEKASFVEQHGQEFVRLGHVVEEVQQDLQALRRHQADIRTKLALYSARNSLSGPETTRQLSYKRLK
jgi:hypothetical protein